jgi:CBS domain-containing protein
MAVTVQQIIPQTQTSETLVTVLEAQCLQDALSLMIEHDFSQLPVVDEDFKLRGLISSDSALRATSYFKCELQKLYVSHAMFTPKICRSDDDIAELLSLLGESNTVLVVGKENRLVGILTGYDTTEYYRKQAEDIMLAEEIELLVRDYIRAAHTNEDELAKYVIESFPDKNKNKKFEDLALGQYIKLLEKKWEKYEDISKLRWDLIFNLLDAVRKIRNSIAHFKGVDLNDHKKLQFCLQLLEKYRPDLELFNQASSSVVIQSGEILIEDLGALTEALSEKSGQNEDPYNSLFLRLQNEISPSLWKIQLAFKEIEDTIQDKLPSSAYKHRTWWSNDIATQSHSQSWLDAGWMVTNVNIGSQNVSFTRIANRQRKYIDFFSNLQFQLQSLQNISVKPASAINGRNWFAVEVTSREIQAPVWLSIAFARKSRLRIELYIDSGDLNQNKTMFDFVASSKSKIEDVFGTPLEWERLDNRRASRIAVYKDNINILQEGQFLQEAENWIIETISSFYHAIAPKFLESLSNTRSSN